MRTSGHDFELAAGFLFAAYIINSASQIRGITNSAPNIVEVQLSTNTAIEAPTSQRGFMMTSACGLCRRDGVRGGPDAIKSTEGALARKSAVNRLT